MSSCSQRCTNHQVQRGQCSEIELPWCQVQTLQILGRNANAGRFVMCCNLIGWFSVFAMFGSVPLRHDNDWWLFMSCLFFLWKGSVLYFLPLFLVFDSKLPSFKSLGRTINSFPILHVALPITIQNIVVTLWSQRSTPHAKWICVGKLWFYISLPIENKSLKDKLDIRVI